MQPSVRPVRPTRLPRLVRTSVFAGAVALAAMILTTPAVASPFPETKVESWCNGLIGTYSNGGTYGGKTYETCCYSKIEDPSHRACDHYVNGEFVGSDADSAPPPQPTAPAPPGQVKPSVPPPQKAP